MFGLALSAVLARRGQATALFVLTVLAVAAAAAAPWYLAAARYSVAQADVDAAGPEQRAFAVRTQVQSAAVNGEPLARIRSDAEAALRVPGAEVNESVLLHGTAVAGGTQVATTMASRTGVCERIAVEGRCPTAALEVVASRTYAARLGLSPGSQLKFQSFRLPDAVTLTVVGVYAVREVDSPYWMYSQLIGSTQGSGFGATADALITDERTLLGIKATGLDVQYHLTFPDSAFTAEGDLGAALVAANQRLAQRGYAIESEAPGLVAQISRDQRLVRVGVTVGAAQILVLCWFVLFFAVRQTADVRRGDIGLLKLRGVSRWRAWLLTAQESAWPMLAGGVVGWGIGYLLAFWLSEPVPSSVLTTQVLVVSVIAGAVAALGALAAAIGAEWQTMRSPIGGLLRRVPSRRKGWRGDALDLAVAVIAVAGVYQGYAESDATEISTLSLLAPALTALAVGLVVARTLPWFGARIGANALRGGRPATTLTALHLARRPGTHRLFAVLVVATAIAGNTALAWYSSTGAWADRAAQEVGASRVLTVRVDGGSGRLLSAVREADPSGEQAMAVTVSRDAPNDQVLAVDSARLPKVALWRSEYGAEADAAVRALTPPVPEPVRVGNGPLTLTAGATSIGDATVTALLDTPAGTRVPVAFKVGATRAAISSTVDKCPAGCRLAGFSFAPPEAAVELVRLATGSTVLIGPERFGDSARWRTQAGPLGIGPEIRARDGKLALADYGGVVPQGQRRSFDVFAVDAPVPLPVLRAGRPGQPDLVGDDRLTPLGVEAVPYRIVGTAPVLPQLGVAGFVVDLEYASRVLSTTAQNVTLQVWLAPGAPQSIVDALTKAGVSVAGETSVASAAVQYSRQGPATALQFQLLAAIIGVLLAAGSLAVTAAVERRPRVAELAALRAQGLPGRDVRRAAFGGYLTVVVGALVTGLVAAVVAQLLVVAALPVFTDGWSVLPVATGPQPLPLALAGGLTLLVLGLTAVYAAGRMVRAVDRSRTANGGQA